MRMIVAALMSAALAGSASAHEVKAGPLTLSDLQVRAVPAGVPTSAAYLTIANAGKTADKLLSVECACASSAMMHETSNTGGISSMAMKSEVSIPAGGKVAFTPNGLHVMLVGVKGGLKAGGMQELTLRFDKAGVVKAGFHVRDVIKVK
jgi:copper(I)-binding protein